MTASPAHQQLSKEHFIEEIKHCVTHDGYGFVPFIGSGISHASGIMIGGALGEYLSYAIWRCVVDYEIKGNAGKDGVTLVNKGWPGRPTQKESQTVREWATRWYCRLLDQHKIRPEMATNFNLADLYRPANTQYRLPPAKPIAFDLKTFDDWQWTDAKQNQMSQETLKQINKSILELHAELLADGPGQLFTPCQGVSRISRLYIVETAVRSLFDWRLALHFLARLRRVDGLLHLAPECDQYVIDSFNIFITRGRRPCLAHQMVSFLARPLRIRKLLTTNFDTLLEDAFRDVNIPLQVFSIERNSRLPDPNSVSVHKTLIKLHGSLHETRADYSLDEPPDDQDKESFLQYLWPVAAGQPVGLPNHLLVLGTSIPDKRNVELIKYVCDRVPEFRLYVIAHNKDTMDTIQDAFGEEYREQIRSTISGSLDLMLYELYQVVTHSLPPAGFKFEFSQYVPPFENEDHFFPASMRLTERRKKKNSRAPMPARRELVFASAEAFRAQMRQQICQSTSRVTVLDSEFAATKIGATLFYELKNVGRKQCVWFELEDFDDPTELLSELFRSISLRLGLYSIENVSLAFPRILDAHKEMEIYAKGDDGMAAELERIWPPDSLWDQVELKISVLNRHFGVDPASWCVFFYGRNVAGSCAGFQETQEPMAVSALDWKLPRFRVLSRLMSLLANNGFHVIYMPYTPAKNVAYRNFDLNPIVKSRLADLDVAGTMRVGSENLFCDPAFMSMGADFTLLEFQLKPEFGLEKSVNQVALYFVGGTTDEEKKRRKRFLYAATLFRHSRHISALTSEAVLKSRFRYERFQKQSTEKGSPEVYAEIVRWVWDLYQCDRRFFNRKPGGFAWMFRDLRLLANLLLEHPVELAPGEQPLQELRTRMHFWIGEWYLRAFYSSNHVDPLREAIFHKLMSLDNIRYAKLKENGEDLTAQYRKILLVSVLSSIAKILMISRESMRYWVADHRGGSLLYWDSIKAALGLRAIKVSRIGEDPGSWDSFRDYVNGRLGPDASILQDEEGEKFLAYVLELLRSIRRECFRLEREMLRDSNYFPGSSDGSGKDEPTGRQYLLLVESTTQFVAVSIEPFVGFKPGKTWDSAFENGFRAEPKKVDEAFAEVRRLCKSHLEAIDTALVAHIRKLKHDCCNWFLCDSSQLYAFMWITTEYIYQLIRQAKFENRGLCLHKLEQIRELERNSELEGIRKSPGALAWTVLRDPAIVTREDAVQRHWELAGMLSQMLLELTYSLSPPYLFREHQLKTKLLTFSGLALGRVHRFDDAHQVLNEAAGITYSMAVSDSRRELAILRLRRAEVHILEARQLGFALSRMVCQWYSDGKDINEPRPPLFCSASTDTDLMRKYRQHIAKLDDAWTVLGEVESMLSSCMHSGFWCGKLYYLRLMVYGEYFVPKVEEGELLYRPKACHELENAGESLVSTLELGLLACDVDHYRALCFLNMIAKACRKMDYFLKQLERQDGTQYADDFKTKVVRRLCRVIAGVPEVELLSPEVKWKDLLPGASDQAGPDFDNFRSKVVANFEAVLGPLSGF
ncbi:MAG: hypothetical protein HPY82_13640 [Gammaproteobacteria bacterium]|nr:hypothetical protein [Gammaproteobacteria bacterium]